MQFLTGLNLALLGWQVYAPVYSSPLNPASTAIDFPLVPGALVTLNPTANGIELAPGPLSTAPPPPPNFNTTNATAGDFPPDPCVIRLEGSPMSVQFWSRHYLKRNRVEQVLQMAQVAVNHHDQTAPIYKTVPTVYSAGKTSLTIPNDYPGQLLWGQWNNGLDAVRLYMTRYDWLGCEFEMFDHNVNRWYYGGRLMSDYAANVTTALNETGTAAE